MDLIVPSQDNEKQLQVVVGYLPDSGQIVVSVGWIAVVGLCVLFSGIVPLLKFFFESVGSAGIVTTVFFVVAFAMELGLALAFVLPSLKTLIFNKLTIDQSGMCFPNTVQLSGAFWDPWSSRRFKWSEIDQMWLQQLSSGQDYTVLRIHTPLRTFEIDPGRLAEEDALSFVTALSTYAAPQHLLHQSDLERLQLVIRQRRVCLTGTIYKAGQLVPRTPEEALLADKQLSLRYTTPFQKCGLALCCLAFPVWGVMGFLGSLALPFVILGHCIAGLTFSALIANSYWLLPPLFFSVGVSLTASFFDHTLTVGEYGISFPLYLAPFLGFRRERLWQEISRFRFIRRGSQPLDHGTIVVCLKSLMHVPIDLSRLSRLEVEILLLAINIWGQSIEQDPELKLLQESLSNQKLGIGEATYTQMWEAEMNRRFSSTNFVPLQPGHNLRDGQLTVVKQLAFGGMSAIYLCQANKTELVVLKEFVVPDLDSKLQEKAQSMFEREAKILMKLSHPRLARVHDYFVEAGRTYLLLDYIPGTDLRQIVLQNGKQPEALVVRWAEQIAEILVYLHGLEPPVIHRDLTPDNILLTASEQVMLIDFGAANEFVGTATGTLVGKESFISPEQFRGDTERQSDIYSLGATLFYLLTAEEPQPLSQSFPREKNPDVSIWMNELVADCTAFEIEKRIPQASALKERLSGYNAGIGRQPREA